jgi:hypothetical protein
MSKAESYDTALDIIVDDGKEIARLKARATKLQSKNKAAEESLMSACKRYCEWYDYGTINLTDSAMAYEMVSAIRKGIAILAEGTTPCPK